MNVRLSNTQIKRLANHIATSNIPDRISLKQNIDTVNDAMFVLTDLFDKEEFERLVNLEFERLMSSIE